MVEVEEPSQEATTAAEGCVLEKDHHPGRVVELNLF